ncbi:hypothetical protein [Alistipes sp. ZOR0009]|uniref:hypothetical protein n=1 Tax=Alistipes sp. ZOR0009 TaxID=1339253 RepID=UPI00064698FF|nr:hypothetical protein [Alistipes sp. ZOR0009]
MQKFLWAIGAIAALSMSSCQKGDDVKTTTDANIETAIDGQTVTNMFAEVDNEVDQVALGLKAGNAPDSTGKRTVTTVKNVDNSLTKTVVYSNWGIGKNKRWVKDGKITVTISADRLTRTVTFENFTINKKKIDGTKTSKIDLVNHTLTLTLTNGKVTFEDGTTYQHQYTQVRTMVKGYDTPLNFWDDEYDITIDASGTNRRGQAFTEVTTTPLHLKAVWPMFVSGIIKREVNNHTIITDFGNGAEDFIVTITVDGTAKEVDLTNSGK